jgi:4-diphosphocytidyl-2-C-methyl-D-erythritol kinase
VSDRSWPAPGKINLFLHVVGRRDDGYHLLQTAFQFLEHGDELEFETRGDGRIERIANYDGIPAERDLVVRAARALRGKGGVAAGASIRVAKHLPFGGGLGGGSSDAATTLVALNRLWGLGLDTDTLAGIGLELGADVPVFVRGRAAWAEGVGEKLTPVDMPEDWLLVVHPGVAVGTAEVFKHPDLTRNTPAITIRAFLAGAGTNICEPLVRKLHPEVAAAIDWLRERGDARMTGTGSCVFLRCQSEREARAVLAELPHRWHGFVTRGRNRSPLLDRLARPD